MHRMIALEIPEANLRGIFGALLGRTAEPFPGRIKKCVVISVRIASKNCKKTILGNLCISAFLEEFLETPL